MKVELFIPCFIDQLYPETAFNTMKILEKAGCEVVYNPEQTCCGQPAYNAGYWADAKEVGTKFLNDFTGVDYIVAPSASCVGMIKEGFSDLFTNTMVHNHCRTVQAKIYELSDFLINVLKKDYYGAELDGRAVFHDSCSGLRQCKIKEEPRQLLSRVIGLELVEIKNYDECCGFGGTFSVKFDAISSAMAEQKINYVLQAGAEYIISTDHSCLLQLDTYIKNKGIAIKTMHLADVLTHGWLEKVEY